MTKELLLKDIEFNIGECDKHLNLNPYPPAQKRVGYVMNNKCRSLDIPFYLNAIYNEEQIKLNTSLDDREKYIYTTPSSSVSRFTMADAKIDEISLKLKDITEKYKQRNQPQFKKSFLGLGEKTGLGAKEDNWVDLISSSTRVTDSEGKFLYNDEQLWLEREDRTVDLSKECENNLQIARRKYNELKSKTIIGKTIAYEPGEKENERYAINRDIEFTGYVDITSYTIQRIEKIINKETKKKTKYKKINKLPFNWDLLSWEVLIDGKRAGYWWNQGLYEELGGDLEEEQENDNIEGYVPPAPTTPEWKTDFGYIVFPVTDLLDKMNKTASDTSESDKLIDENEEIKKLIQNFEKDYFDPYYKEYSDFRKSYSWDGEASKKEVKGFNKVKSLVDKMFNVINKYKDKVPQNESLAGFIQKYETHDKKYSVNQDRPTITNFDDSSTAKKMQLLMKEKEQVLKTGNASLQQYYRNKEINYLLEKEKHIQQMLKNADLISKKESLFTTLIDPENLRYNGLQTAFIQHLNAVLAANEKKLKKLDEKYKQNLFKESDIKVEIIVKFIPDSIPQYFYMQQLDKGFVYEDLLKRIEEIVKELNEKKKKLVYCNTKGKLLQKERLAELLQIGDRKKQLTDENTMIDQMLPLKQEEMRRLDLEEKQALSLIPYTDDPYQKQMYFMDVSKYYGDKRDAIQGDIDSLTSQKIANEQQMGALTQRQNTLVNQCKNFNDQLTPLIQATSGKYDVYDQKKNLQEKLDIVKTQLQQNAALNKTQTELSQTIMTTNNFYLLKRALCEPYFEYQRQLQAARESNDQEAMAQAEDNMRAWSKGHWQSLDELDKYLNDLKTEKENYMSNLSTLNQQKNLVNDRKDLLAQIAQTDAQIKLLESDLISLKIIENEDGSKSKRGYSFSTTGLYKNVYIDVQEGNEWLVLRLNLKDLYAYYNNNLPSGLIKEPSASKEELLDCFPMTAAGEALKLIHNPKDGTCNWFLPLDFEIFGPGIELPLKLTTNVYKTDDYGKKIPKYSVDDKGNAKEITGYMSLKRLMGVMNGTGYIFTGLRITLYYTGMPGPSGISVFISGVGMEYGTLMAGGYTAATPYNIYLLHKYPYGNHSPLSSFYWLQVGALADGVAAVMGKMPIEVTFKIYKKIPLPCGYPKKCGVLKPEEYANRGVCGLKVFFETTYDLTTDFDEKTFDIGTYMEIVLGNDILGGDISTGFLAKAKEAAIEGARGAMGDAVKKVSSNLLSNLNTLSRTMDTAAEKAIKIYEKNFGPVGGRAAQFLLAKRNIAQWGNTSYTLATNTWNIRDAVDNVGSARKVATEQAQAVMNKMKGDLYDLIPPECREIICDTIKKSRQDSIKDLGMSINESTKINVDTLNSFMKRTVTDTLDDLAEKAGSVVDGIKNTGKFIGDAVGNFFSLFDFFSMTQYCPRRLSDITKDINPLRQIPSAIPGTDGFVEFPEQPSVFNQLNSMIGDLIIGNVMGSLNNCITRSITTNNINYSSMFPEGTRKYLAAANTVGDIANMARGMGGYKMSLEDLFHEANRSSILANFANIDTGNISLGYLTDFLDEHGVSEIVDVNKWLDSSSTITNLKNTIGKAVSNNNDIMKKLANGEVLSMNDQYKQLAGLNLMEKTLDWAKRNSDIVNTGTGIALNVKGLLNTDFSNAWKDPHVVTNKLQNISSIMGNMMAKERAQKKKEEDLMKQAFSTSDEVLQMKYYATLRWEYLEKLTKKDFSEQKDVINKLSINI